MIWAWNWSEIVLKFGAKSHQIHYDFAPNTYFNLLRFRTKIIMILHQIWCENVVKLVQNCNRKSYWIFFSCIYIYKNVFSEKMLQTTFSSKKEIILKRKLCSFVPVTMVCVANTATTGLLWRCFLESGKSLQRNKSWHLEEKGEEQPKIIKLMFSDLCVKLWINELIWIKSFEICKFEFYSNMHQNDFLQFW